MTKLKDAFKYLLILTVIFGMASCSSDDDPVTTPTDGIDVSGQFTGYNKMVFAYAPQGIYTDGDTVNISSVTDGKVTVTYKNDSWETTLTDVAVTDNEAKTGYTLTGAGKMSMAGMGGGQKKDYDCTLAGTISKDKKTYTLTFTLPSVMGGTTIEFINGKAPAAKYLAGSYSGWSKMVMMYAPDGITNDGEKATISANEDGTVNITYNTDSWETTFTNVALAENDNEYSLTGEGTMKMGMGGSEKKDYPCTLAGTISKDKKTYSLVFTLPSVMSGTTITFANGSAPAKN